MGDLIAHVCAVENNGGAVLEALLRDKQANAPLTSELLRNDLIVVAVWYIWWEQRQVTHGETIQSPQRTAQAIITLTLNYSRACKKKIGIDRHGWVKPREDYVKLNVDARFCDDEGSGSTGAIIRDDTGRFIAASCCRLPFVSDAPTVEARALRDGLILATQVGCNRIEVNSDCMEVIEIMNDGGNFLGAAAAIYEDCILLCRSFTHVLFHHTPREANMAAHNLARYTTGDMSTVWHEDPPDFLVAVMANDVTVM
jgi:ribonuclease HI